MRRQDRELTAFGDMMDVVRACECCRIGLVDGGRAYIVPLNFGFETGDDTLTLYFHSAPAGRKIDLLRACPDVSFEMDAQHALVRAQDACGHSFRYCCVMGTGRMQFVTDEAEKRRGLEALMAHYTGRTDWPLRPELAEKVTVLKLEVAAWTCKAHR